MELKDLKYAAAVAETGGFRRAAARLRTPQSAVSRRVRELEDELGVSIFERGRHGVRLTSAGQSFIEGACAAMRELDYAVRQASDAGRAASGTLRLGVVTSLASGFQRDLITAYCAAIPSIKLAIAEAAHAQFFAQLKARSLDLALVTGQVPGQYGDSEVLWTEHVHVALPAHHPLATKSEIAWIDLQAERFVVTAAEPGPEIHDYIVRRLTGLGHRPLVTRHEVGRETILNMVGMGFGLSLVGTSWTGTAYPGVVFRRIEGDDDKLPFSAVWLHDNDNPALRRFLSLARAMSKTNLRPPDG
jgi:DNA-binding transcriptional LysR family regulator